MQQRSVVMPLQKSKLKGATNPETGWESLYFLALRYHLGIGTLSKKSLNFFLLSRGTIIWNFSGPLLYLSDAAFLAVCILSHQHLWVGSTIIQYGALSTSYWWIWCSVRMYVPLSLAPIPSLKSSGQGSRTEFTLPCCYNGIQWRIHIFSFKKKTAQDHFV